MPAREEGNVEVGLVPGESIMHRGICPCLGLLTALFLTGADWPQFRGADSSGVSTETNIPRTISDEIAWAADLPGRGLSGPIVVGDRVFLTASSGYQQDRLHL